MRLAIAASSNISLRASSSAAMIYQDAIGAMGAASTT